MVATDHKSENLNIYTHRDGLMDIFIGLLVLIASQLIRADLVWMVAIYIPIFLPVWKAARNQFIHQRIGPECSVPHFHAKGALIKFRFTLLLGILLFVGLGILSALGWLSGATGDWINHHFTILLGLIFSTIWMLAAIILKLPRFFIHSIFTQGVFISTQFSQIQFWVALSLTGGLMIFVGCIVLIKFIRLHPYNPS